MGWRGILTGALALVFLETVVQPGASGRVSGLVGDLSKLALRFLDPAVPAIGAAPKAAQGSGSGSSSSGGGASSILGDILGHIPIPSLGGGTLDGLGKAFGSLTSTPTPGTTPAIAPV